MKSHSEMREQLNDYIDGAVTAEEKQEFELHLASCRECQQELQQIRLLLNEAARLPRAITPPQELWPGIEQRLKHHQAAIQDRVSFVSRYKSFIRSAFGFDQRLRFVYQFGIAVTVLAIAFIGFWISTRPAQDVWKVSRIEGTLTIGSESFANTADLHIGEWIETDESSRARITVADIGVVEVEPKTRIRLVRTNKKEHRLELAVGSMSATTWAPPRIFFVETPSGVATDMGCAFRIVVDDSGRSLLLVTAGWVAIGTDDNESLVPSGAMCETRPGLSPGTPFAQDAPQIFRDALSRFDFEKGGFKSLTVVLKEARKRDAITLWHLLTRTDRNERGNVYDRLALLVPPPQDVTKDGVVNQNKNMIDSWQAEIGLTKNQWWKWWNRE